MKKVEAFTIALLLGILAAPLLAQEGRRRNVDEQPEDTPKLVLETGGFTTSVRSIEFSPNGRLLAVGGADKTVRIWDLAGDGPVVTLRGYDGTGTLGTCSAVNFSPDGRYLVVGVQDFSETGTIRVYRTSELDQIESLLPAHPHGGILALSFSGNGKYLASAGTDGDLILWDWPARRQIRSWKLDGPLLYLGFERMDDPVLVVATKGNDETIIKVWSAANGKRVAGQDHSRRWSKIEGLSPGGMVKVRRAYLEAGRGLQGGFGTVDRPNRFWVRVSSTNPADGPPVSYEGHRYQPTALALSPDRQLVASGDLLGSVHVWEVRTGRRLHQYDGGGQPLYRVGVGSDGKSIAFGSNTFQRPEWRFNHFAPADRTFDLEARRLLRGKTGIISEEVVRKVDRELTLDFEKINMSMQNNLINTAPDNVHLEFGSLGDHPVPIRSFLGLLATCNIGDVFDVNVAEPSKAPAPTIEGGFYSITCKRSGQVESRYRFHSDDVPMCYSFLHSRLPGFADPVVVGTFFGTPRCLDPATMMTRRVFLGHQGSITSLAESRDGRFLVTSSTDRTIRIWSLKNFQPLGWPDFDAVLDDGIIYNVVKGGFAEKAGIKIFDRIRTIDGLDRTAILGRFLAHRWDYHPGQRVVLELDRKNPADPTRVQVELVAGADYVEPILSLFVAKDGEWVMWTPQGYYDASPKGDRLIGWHVNRGRDRAADLYEAHRFRARYCRPELITQVIQLGEIPGEVAGQDLRVPGMLSRLEPPHVRLLEPSTGTITQQGRIKVKAEVRSVNGLPTREVTFLVNGRPSAARIGNDELGGAPVAIVSREVDLIPGVNQIAVLASNEASDSPPSAAVAVTRIVDDPDRALPNLFVLSVGISRYKRPGIDLKYAHRDAQEFAAAWTIQRGSIYGQVEAKVLTDERATASEIRKGMDWLARMAKPQDTAVLFLSAHGVLDSLNNYYVATHDVDLQSLRSTAIRWGNIKELFQDLPCKFLLFVDTCHSGGVTGMKSVRLDQEFRDLITEDSGAVVFASSLGRESSEENSTWGHGAFTIALLDCFKGGNADLNKNGFLSLTELHFGLAERVKVLTGDRQHAVAEFSTRIPDYDFYKLVKSGN